MAVGNYSQIIAPTRRRMSVEPDPSYTDPYAEAIGGVDPANPQAVMVPPSYPAPPRTNAGTFQPNTQTDDINRMWRDNRTEALDEGSVLDYDLRQQQDYRGGLEGQYRGTMNDAYGNLLQTPGYTPEEASGITRENQFNSLLTPDSEFNRLNATDEEQSGIRGNVGSYDEFFDPDQLRGIDINYANMARGQVGEAKQNVAGALEQQRADYDTALDQGGQKAALKAGETRVRGTIDPGKLRYDQNVADASRITDQDVRDWQAQAGNTVRNRYAAAKDAVVQGAAAQGNADALAVAAGRAQLENREAVGAADALTNARIQGRALQTGRNMDLEQARLAAEGNYAGLASTNEQALAARALAAEEAASGRKMTAAGTLGANRLSGAEFTGNLATGVETGIGSQEANTGKYIASTGANIRQAQDVNASNRESGLYNARNANQQYQIGTKYGQGFGVNQQLSNAATNVANARRAGQGEYRTWTADQTAQQQQAQQNAASQRVAAYGARMGATNQATSGLSNWEVGNQDNTVFNKALKVAGMGITGYKAYKG